MQLEVEHKAGSEPETSRSPNSLQDRQVTTLSSRFWQGTYVVPLEQNKLRSPSPTLSKQRYVVRLSDDPQFELLKRMAQIDAAEPQRTLSKLCLARGASIVVSHLNVTSTMHGIMTNTSWIRKSPFIFARARLAEVEIQTCGKGVRATMFALHLYMLESST